MKGKKYSIIVPLICICVSLIGCGKNNSSKSSDSDKKASEISNNSQDTESTNESDNISFEFKKDSNIDETILYDEKEMKIVAKTLEYGNSAVSLKVEITNKTKKQISVVSGTLGFPVNAINGFMTKGGYLNCDIPAGSTIEEELKYTYNDLLIMGISEIADITLGFMANDGDYNKIAQTDVINIKTNIASSYDYAGERARFHKMLNSDVFQNTYESKILSFSDQELLSENGIAILSKTYVENKDGKRSLMLEIKNESDSVLYFRTLKLKANDVMLYDGTWSQDVIAPGKLCIVDINISKAVEKAEEKVEIGDITDISCDISAATQTGMVAMEHKDFHISIK